MIRSEAIDHGRLMAEINAEVRRRRDSGELPADFERELDLTFARLAPVDALGDDFEQVLSRAEEATFIDVLAPVVSDRPGGAFVKKVIRRAVLWEVRHVTQQISGFAHVVIRALRLLDERLRSLERLTQVPDRTALGDRSVSRDVQASAPSDGDHWGPILQELLGDVSGRVLHAEAGSGALVERLRGAGKEAYGVEPSETASLLAVERGLDVRPDDVLAHLESLPIGALGGLVLSGCVDRLPPGFLVDLARLAAAKLVSGGRVVVLSSHPQAWAMGRSPLDADLTAGHPLWPATWEHLLAAQGFTGLRSYEGPAGERLRPVGEAVIDENLERLNGLLFSPESYAVSGERPT